MTALRRQNGMTVIGWVLSLVVLAFGVLFVLRLVPVYVESFKVDNALNSLIRDPATADSSRNDIIKKFVARMNIEDIDRFDTEQKVKDYLTVEKGNGRVVIRMQYQTVAPLVSNLSIVADWDKEVSRP
ncbi:MAG: DUF4845 domain-containing protein [Gammaproteobacteria bacterium]|jgi:hypothetical protein|nr:DUF4845 domain-containing protein [Gammaproteobacteria bacterium]